MAEDNLRHDEIVPQGENSGADPMGQVSSSDIEKILAAGQLAKIKLYQTLLTKIKQGETLKPAEIKALSAIEKELEGQSGNTDPPKVIATYQEAAEYCGFSKRTLSHHVGRGNLRQNEDGSFDREELDRFLAKKGRRKRRKDPKEPLSVADEKDLADLRWRLARAQKEEILVLQLKENLVAREEIARGWAARVAEVTAGLNALVDRLPPLLVGKSQSEMRGIIEEEVWNLRDRYARQGKHCPAI